MKLARFNGGCVGLVQRDSILDVTDAAGIDPAEWTPAGIVRIIAVYECKRALTESLRTGGHIAAFHTNARKSEP